MTSQITYTNVINCQEGLLIKSIFLLYFQGDSAGANLCIAVTMKCNELGIRPPDGLFVAYVPVVVSLVPSPARLLCLMDPLLPFGFLMGCLKGNFFFFF